MLKTRIKTAAILIPAVLLGIWFLPTPAFALVSGLVFLLGAWEWTALAGFSTWPSRIGVFVAMPLMVLSLLAILQQLGSNVLKEGAPFLVIVFWLLALAALFRYPRNATVWQSRTLRVLMGCLVLVPAWWLLVALQYADPRWVLYVLSLVCLADTAAYFTGRRWGKHQLLPLVSPGKTWEGALGAIFASLGVIMIGFVVLEPARTFLDWLVLGILTVIFSMVGDLFESLFKRMAGVKDSGTLLPGHGGILDRIDSLTAAIPIFTIGFLFFR